MVTARSSRTVRPGNRETDTQGERYSKSRSKRGKTLELLSKAAETPAMLTLAGQHLHFVGIGGAALSGLAGIALAQGATVSGSDLTATGVTERLAQQGATVHIGHAASQIGAADLVVISSAVPETNPEVAEARRQGIRVLKRHEFVGQLMQGHIGVGVAGTHGKTTTTSLLSVMLMDAKLDPTLLVGGEVRNLGLSARSGEGPHFVVEADEYDRAFLHMPCHVALVTNIEADHPDMYPTLDDMVGVYRQFMSQIPQGGTLVANWDDPRIRELIKGMRGKNSPIIVTYGVAHSGQWWAADVTPNDQGGHDFTVWRLGRNQGRFSIGLPGLHNVSNALGALAAGERLGLTLDQCRASLARFQGAARRLELKGEVGGVTVIDTYAHHPSEIRADLAAMRQRYAGRTIWAVFQPHTYSRTATLIGDFARAFREAHHVLVTDIFAARETDTHGVHSRDLVGRMAHADARYVPSLSDAVAALTAEMQPGDVVVTLGAGDVWKVAEELMRIA